MLQHDTKALKPVLKHYLPVQSSCLVEYLNTEYSNEVDIISNTIAQQNTAFIVVVYLKNHRWENYSSNIL